MKRNFIAVCSLSLVFAACSSTPDYKSEEIETTKTDQQVMPSEQMPGTASTSTSDKPFSKDLLTSEMILNQMHHLNQNEIRMAELAQDRASSDQVKSFARQLVNDHQNLETRVEQVAKSSGVTLQDFQPSTTDRAMMDRLRDLNGSQFDQAFTMFMDSGHKNALASFKSFKKESKNSEIIALINQATPKIQKHADTSLSLMKSSTRMGGMAGEASPENSSDTSLTEGTSPSGY